MKMNPNVFGKEMNLSLSDCVKQIIFEESGYFLDYDNPQLMFDEFIGCAASYIDWTQEDELINHKEEIIQILIDERNRLNKENYKDFVECSADFMRNAWLEDFCEDCDYPIYGDIKAKAFKDAIKLLYNKYCNEKVE